MPLYRGALAELRRVHREARWVLSGVLVEGRFHAAARNIEPVSDRLIQSGLVARHPLMPFIAPENRAVEVALSLGRAMAADPRTVADRWVLRWHRVERIAPGDG